MFLVIKCSKRPDIASSEFMFVAAHQWGDNSLSGINDRFWCNACPSCGKKAVESIRTKNQHHNAGV